MFFTVLVVFLAVSFAGIAILYFLFMGAVEIFDRWMNKDSEKYRAAAIRYQEETIALANQRFNANIKWRHNSDTAMCTALDLFDNSDTKRCILYSCSELQRAFLMIQYHPYPSQLLNRVEVYRRVGDGDFLLRASFDRRNYIYFLENSCGFNVGEEDRRGRSDYMIRTFGLSILAQFENRSFCDFF